jgi:GNAT superfamily N-acetyltransferase
MLKVFYSEKVLRENAANNGNHFILAYEDSACLGFASFQHDYLYDTITRLHKIYLLPEAQGKGVGRLLSDSVIDYAKKNH